jgi:outer membrane protein OmpA-like peptidoglycan-associated protein
MMGAMMTPAGEWLVGGWSPLDDQLRMRLAGGTGLTSGMGTPTFRLLAGVDWNPPPPPEDLDLDGLVKDDLCPESPEDVDGTADADGCPELDDDQDGVVDAEDGCRDVPEDRDHVADGDGCPEPEVPVRVRVVNRSGDLVPLAVASIDGERRDGGDLYLELVPGTYHLSARSDGYEAVDEDVVVQERELAVDLVLPPQRIAVDTTLSFATDSSQLTMSSRAALATVAQTLLDHPEIEVLRIEGHTDARGDAMMNLRLSERRAASVRAYLIERGVAPERLVDQGYGESRPLDNRAVPEAWGKNRRVELVVDRWAD